MKGKSSWNIFNGLSNFKIYNTRKQDNSCAFFYIMLYGADKEDECADIRGLNCRIEAEWLSKYLNIKAWTKMLGIITVFCSILGVSDNCMATWQQKEIWNFGYLQPAFSRLAPPFLFP